MYAIIYNLVSRIVVFKKPSISSCHTKYMKSKSKYLPKRFFISVNVTELRADVTD